MDILNVFTQLGLSEEHMKIYLASLEWGETSITNLARKSGIARTSIYSQITELLDAGLITQSPRLTGKYYKAADPEYLEQLLARRQLEITQSISELSTKMSNLKAMQKTSAKKPNIQYLEGAEGIKQAYEKSLSDNPREIFIQCLTEDYGEAVSEEFFDSYFERFFSSPTKSKELLSEADEEYINKYGRKNKLQLKMDIAEKTETDVMVYDDKVIFVSFNREKPYALVIEDSEVAKTMRNLYDKAWKYAAKNDPRVKRGEKVQTEFED